MYRLTLKSIKIFNDRSQKINADDFSYDFLSCDASWYENADSSCSPTAEFKFEFFSPLQILSWLCKKGEDILSKHAQHTATNLTSARLHEREFEKFYFTSMVSNVCTCVDCPVEVNGIERSAPRGIESLS